MCQPKTYPLTDVPLFKDKVEIRSITDLPEWERVRGLLTERIGEEYELVLSQLPMSVFGKSEFEILRDTKHYSMVYPILLNHRMKLHKFVPERESLALIDVGFAPDGTGTQLAGIWASFLNRRFIDGFVACMRDVYNASWESMHVRVVRGGPLPIFLVSEVLQ